MPVRISQLYSACSWFTERLCVSLSAVSVSPQPEEQPTIVVRLHSPCLSFAHSLVYTPPFPSLLLSNSLCKEDDGAALSPRALGVNDLTCRELRLYPPSLPPPSSSATSLAPSLSCGASAPS